MDLQLRVTPQDELIPESVLKYLQTITSSSAPRDSPGISPSVRSLVESNLASLLPPPIAKALFIPPSQLDLPNGDQYELESVRFIRRNNQVLLRPIDDDIWPEAKDMLTRGRSHAQRVESETSPSPSDVAGSGSSTLTTDVAKEVSRKGIVIEVDHVRDLESTDIDSEAYFSCSVSCLPIPPHTYWRTSFPTAFFR
jgi:hypothetical protein